MDKKIAGLLGAAAALTTVSTAQAMPAQAPAFAPAASYRDLLDPIPNALTLLQVDDARLATPAAETAAGGTQLVQYHHHHHHHHHVVPRVIRQFIPRRHHHHHHHHHRPGIGIIIR